jgi:hypothetical protein
MAGYTRTDTGNNIANGNVIDADDFDAEYNAIESGFNASTGHSHDGSAGEGAPITKMGPSQDLIVSTTSVLPKTTNTLDLGSSGVQFKDAFFDGTIDTDVLTVSGNSTVGGTLGVTGLLTATGGVSGAVTGNVTGNVNGNVTGTVSDVSNHDTDDISEGSTNLYFTTQRSRDSVSATGSIGYDSSTGVMSFTQGNTDTVAEGSTNLYYTTLRAQTDAKTAISVTDSGGDGSLTYSAGAITYTGPSATETRAHFTAGTGVSYSNGQFSIGQAVGASSNVTFNDATVNGNLTVNGTTTTVKSNDVNIGDATLTLNADETGTPSQDAGITIERGLEVNKAFHWDESEGEWSTYGDRIKAGTFEGNLSGTVSTAAQPNITSLGTLTTLTVDDITINSSTISDAGTLTIDSNQTINLDSSFGQVRFIDDGQTRGGIEFGTNLQLDFEVGSSLSTEMRLTTTGAYIANSLYVGSLSGSLPDNRIYAEGTIQAGGQLQAGTDVYVGDDIIMTAGAQDWKFEVGASNELEIYYGSTKLFKLDSSGNLTVRGDVTAKDTSI